MDEHTMRPTRSPQRPRRRIQPPAAPPHITRRVDDVTARHGSHAVVRPETQMEGGNGSGRGPIDDDGRGRRPERPEGNDFARLLVALGIIALGAGVVSARLLSQSGRRRRFLRST